MKTPDQVGKDFDDYVKQWATDRYRTESGFDGHELTHAEDEEQLNYPGDEWGRLQSLIDLYRPLFLRLLPGPSSLNVLEIGSGGGRATQAVLEVIGHRVNEYHVIDVSEAFVDVLRQRIDHPIQAHVVRDVDLSGLPTNHFHLCLAQSSWSHIGAYDQYRYLRDLRGVLAHRAPIVVNGQFLLGLGDDWTWNRFRRRVYQAEHSIEGVYHEFTSVSGLVEQLTRFEYDIELVHPAGFIARREQSNPEASISSLGGRVPSYPFLRSIHEFALGTMPTLVSVSRTLV